MKTHPHLLVRDALASLFVSAAQGDPDARAHVRALYAWANGDGEPPALACEDGDSLFSGAGLAPRFTALESYVRDRATRFDAACSWLEHDGAFGDPLEGARAAWEAGLFFEVHEIVEPAWLACDGPRRPLLQGVIMAGAALHHLSNGNLAGARGLLADAARHLATPDPDAVYDFPTFAHHLTALTKSITTHQIQTIQDIPTLPTLARTQTP